MRFSNSVLCALFTMIGSASYAEDCWICDDVVEVSTVYAECYVANYDLLIESFDKNGIDRQQINFSGCSSDGNTNRSKRGLLTMGSLPKQPETSTKTVYTLSRSSAVCLRDLIEQFDGPFDPSIVFKLNEQCIDE